MGIVTVGYHDTLFHGIGANRYHTGKQLGAVSLNIGIKLLGKVDIRLLLGIT